MRRPSGVLRPAAATAWPITWPPNTCPPGCGEESPSKARTVVGEARDSSTVISRRSSSDTRPALITDGSGVSGEDEVMISMVMLRHARVGPAEFYDGDRKSTRLNSSHVAISYTV